jgi:putrescine transport system substrate-binding protein
MALDGPETRISGNTSAVEPRKCAGSATPFLDKATADDPAIYPPPDLPRQLIVHLVDSPEQSRAITRIWQKFKTGQ